MSDVYALKQSRPDGPEWIQEHDSLADALRYRSHSGGVLVKRQPLPGEPGLWWVEVEHRLPRVDRRAWWCFMRGGLPQHRRFVCRTQASRQAYIRMR